MTRETCTIQTKLSFVVCRTTDCYIQSAQVSTSWIISFYKHALPPVRPVGVRCIGCFKDQHQELVHLQQEAVSAVLRKETSQQSVLVLTQGLLILFWDTFKWILKNTGNAKIISHNNNTTLLKRSAILLLQTITLFPPLHVCTNSAVWCLTPLSRSIFSDLSEARSCHRATQCFR